MKKLRRNRGRTDEGGMRMNITKKEISKAFETIEQFCREHKMLNAKLTVEIRMLKAACKMVAADGDSEGME